MPSAVTDLVRLGSFDQRGGGDECQEGVDEVPDELVARNEEEDRQEDKNEREDDEGGAQSTYIMCTILRKLWCCFLEALISCFMDY